jgi:glycosyltransferase involved in cell wall biosynthesis
VLRLVFLIRSLEAGGAERQLAQLATSLDKRQFAVTVITYYPGGALAGDLAAQPGVTVISLDKQGRGDLFGFLGRLLRTVRAQKADIIHGYMWGANELAWVAGRLTGARVVWGVRASNVDFSHYDWGSRWLFRAGAWLSGRADLIIANSEAGRRHHAREGYAAERMIVIANGIDVDRFRPDAAARARVRAEWQIADDAIVVGIAGRLDPMKDHETFLRAAAQLLERLPAARFVIVGAGAEAAQPKLEQSVNDARLHQRLRWVGARQDMPAVYNAFDIAVSSSAFGEGFSNTVGEAMACGVPCVATDVGDAAVIIADSGRVVPPGRPDLLADAIADLAAVDRSDLGRRARHRIVRDYSTKALADRTASALLEMTGRPFVSPAS